MQMNCLFLLDKLGRLYHACIENKHEDRLRDAERKCFVERTALPSPPPPPPQPLVASSRFLVALKTIDIALTSILIFTFFVKTIVSLEKE